MSTEQPLTSIKGIGPEKSKLFKKLGIATVDELVHAFPRRYDDFSSIQKIKNIQPGTVTIQATLKQIKGRYVRRGMHVTEAVASDDTGSVRLIWFNQPYRENGMRTGDSYFISGLFELSHQRLAIMNPAAELVSDFPVQTARILPVYRETKGLKSSQIRKTIQTVLPDIRVMPEALPAWVLQKHHFIGRDEALMQMHFPSSQNDLDKARKRLAFEEVFELSLASLLNKYDLLKDESLQIPFDEELSKSFVKHLPFSLTDPQRKTVWQIYLDLQKNQPMNRLVEGDVGSGKTVVAAMAAAMVMKQGYQVAFMAPTELLARQHAESLRQLLKPLGMQDYVGMLTGSLKPNTKKLLHSQIANGSVRLIVGTHALIQDAVAMKRLGLVIVDEQHRFGVDQRKKLQAKAGHMPHVLHMTATPIPRSLALTLYGELDISVIDVKPEGRLPIITKICSPNSRKSVYEQIDAELNAGRQMFVVCPLINDSDEMIASSAESVYKNLSNTTFKHRRVGLLHGKMKPEEKQTVMELFVSHKLDILVSTTVIEVGVNVPNATVMLIESANRFGLAQIHQLRGRVGRSTHQGYCYLMLGDSKPPSRRLRALELSNDGFKLAELDLEIRGPGAIYGTLQHGQLDLRVASLTDVKTIASARQDAQEFIERKENLLHYEKLYKRVKRLRTVTNLQ